MESEIKKIKFKEKDIAIVYSTREAKEDGSIVKQDITLVSNEKPLPEFEIAMKELRSVAIDIIEIDAGVEQVTITGLSFVYGDSDGVVITGQAHLANYDAVFNFNTPLLYFQHENSGLELTSTAIQKIRKARLEAQKYKDGERAQINMFPLKNEVI